MKRKASFTLIGRPSKAAARPFKKPAQRKALVVVAAPRANVRTGGFMDLERKFVDYDIAADAFTNVWAGGEMEDATALSLSAVAQGNGESQRDGRVYHIHSCHVKGFFSIAATESQTAPIADQVARIALVWDTQTNGAQLNAEDVFLTVTAGQDINSWRNLQFSKRFIVLKDKIVKIHVPSTNEGGPNLFSNGFIQVPFKINKTFKTPIKIRCSGTTAAIASITDNSLHFIGTATGPQVLMTYASRCRFTG